MESGLVPVRGRIPVTQQRLEVPAAVEDVCDPDHVLLNHVGDHGRTLEWDCAEAGKKIIARPATAWRVAHLLTAIFDPQNELQRRLDTGAVLDNKSENAGEIVSRALPLLDVKPPNHPRASNTRRLSAVVGCGPACSKD